MNSNFTAGFGDELVKMAKYPISRLLTGRKAGAVSVAPIQAMLAPAGIPIASGATYGLRAASRAVHGRGLQGRLMRGGKGLMKGEKKRLAEALDVSVPKLEKMIASYSKKKGGGKTYPISRAASIPNVLRRAMHGRAFAGRALRGGKGMTKREKQLLADLRAEGKGADRRRVLGLGAGAAGAAGAAKAMKD